MIAAAIAVVIVLIAAAIAIRSASQPDAEPGHPPRTRADAGPRNATPADAGPPPRPAPPVLAEPVPAPPPESDWVGDETQTMAPIGISPISRTPPLAAPPRASAPAVPAPFVAGTPVILEDLRLDDVLAVAAEPADPPRHPTLRLVGGITVLGLVFAGALLVVVRSLGSVFGNFLK